jgi:hypothetical protein
MLLPFELLLKHMESAVLREFEIAFRISSKNARELDDAFMVHINKFEEAIRAEFEKIQEYH